MNGFLSLAQSVCVRNSLSNALKTKQRTADGLPSGTFSQNRLLMTSEGANNFLDEHHENVRSTSHSIPSLLPVVQTLANLNSDINLQMKFFWRD
jgi:hypothetical protein